MGGVGASAFPASLLTVERGVLECVCKLDFKTTTTTNAHHQFCPPVLLLLGTRRALLLLLLATIRSSLSSLHRGNLGVANTRTPTKHEVLVASTAE